MLLVSIRNEFLCRYPPKILNHIVIRNSHQAQLEWHGKSPALSYTTEAQRCKLKELGEIENGTIKPI